MHFINHNIIHTQSINTVTTVLSIIKSTCKTSPVLLITSFIPYLVGWRMFGIQPRITGRTRLQTSEARKKGTDHEKLADLVLKSLSKK